MPDLSFRGNELAGETDEACNVIKKLERERQGWRGSRATQSDLAEELADVVICADLCAVTAGIDLSAAVVSKFNATSEEQGLSTKLAILASTAISQPPTSRQWPASYDETFAAIGKAVTVHPGGDLGISVKEFYRALAYPDAPTSRHDAGEVEALRAAISRETKACREEAAGSAAEMDFSRANHFNAKAEALEEALAGFPNSSAPAILPAAPTQTAREGGE